MIKKILILSIILLLSFSMAGAVLWDLKEIITGKQMVPDDNSGAPWFADGAKLYFGTGQDVYMEYLGTSLDKFYINDTDLYLEQNVVVGEDLTVTGAVSAGGGTINSGVYNGNFKIPGTYTFRIIGGLSTLQDLIAKSIISNTTISGTVFRPTSIIDSGAISATAATLASVYSNSTVTGTVFRPTSIVNSGASSTAGATKTATMAVNSTDGLTVNSIIVPQAITIPVIMDADVTANGTVFIPISGNYQVIGVSEAHSVAVNVLPKPRLTLIKCTGTQVPATAGVAIMSNKIDLGGTVETIQTATLYGGLGTTSINTTERLCVRLDNPVTGLSGGCLSISVKRIA